MRTLIFNPPQTKYTSDKSCTLQTDVLNKTTHRAQTTNPVLTSPSQVSLHSNYWFSAKPAGFNSRWQPWVLSLQSIHFSQTTRMSEAERTGCQFKWPWSCCCCLLSLSDGGLDLFWHWFSEDSKGQTIIETADCQSLVRLFSAVLEHVWLTSKEHIPLSESSAQYRECMLGAEFFPRGQGFYLSAVCLCKWTGLFICKIHVKVLFFQKATNYTT